jgi:hypothetical protein
MARTRDHDGYADADGVRIGLDGGVWLLLAVGLACVPLIHRTSDVRVETPTRRARRWSRRAMRRRPIGPPRRPSNRAAASRQSRAPLWPTAGAACIRRRADLPTKEAGFGAVDPAHPGGIGLFPPPA